MAYRLLADAVLVAHLSVVLFVVGGLTAIIVGNRRSGWAWVNFPGFRLAHLAAIAFVVAQAWLGAACPLTLLESWLRTRGGAAPYSRGFIEHWVQWLIYYDAPGWAFTLAYTGFAILVLIAWRIYPPVRPREPAGDD